MSRWTLAKGWQWATAGEIADIVGGGTPSTKNSVNFTEKGIPWLTPADLSGYQEEYVSRGKRDLSKEGYESCGAQLMPGDAVLFTSRAPVGYCVLAANEICTNQGFKSLVLKGKISPKFIRHYLLTSKSYAESLASGSTFKELSGKRMAELEIPIPPLNEQKRIVDRIQELQACSRRASEALEPIPDLIEQLRQSILAAAFRGDITKDWRKKNPDIEPASKLLKRIRAERRKHWEDAKLEKLKAKGLAEDKLYEEFSKQRKKYKEPASVNPSYLPKLPQGWCWASLSELSSAVKPISYGVLQPGDELKNGVKLIRVCDLHDGIVLIDQLRTISPQVDRQYERTRLEGGELLVSVVGTIGRLAIANNKLAGANIARAIARLLPCKLVHAYWLMTMLSSPFLQDWLVRGAREVARKTLNIGVLEKTPIPLASKCEMERVFSQIDKQVFLFNPIQEAINEVYTRLARLDQSILSKAFRGELFPQDPNDEPASVLLERIREEKEREAAKQKSRDKQRGRKMKKKRDKQKDVLIVLREANRIMTPEEVFAAVGFEEDSVDAFYAQLRKAVVLKKVREIRKGDLIQLEAIGQ